MGIAREYKNVIVLIHNDVLPSLVDRIIELFDQVATKLPNEEQFEIPGEIHFLTKQGAIEYWDMMNPKIGTSTDFRRYNKDGNCTYAMNEKTERYLFYITIITDDLESKSDDYIKGLIAHEISEMSYTWRVLQDNKENLKKLKPKARQVRFNQITKQNAAIGTKDHQERENDVDNEARRLGFSKEIDALNS
ncbi:MAG TPA: hypothetical protein VG896_01605 [Candidatus Nitrosotalea sp.]|nr:hypothetical protein [Candidatus Nitrosotalea sp.]